MQSQNGWKVLKVGGVAALAALMFLAIAAPRPSRGQDKAEEFGYVGSKKCKKCHIKQFKSWEKTKMAKAFDILAPGTHADAKTKAGLEVDKDYRKDEKCLKCHTVGFGKPGGFTLDYDAEKDKDRLLGVGCESCHGPGEAFLGDGMHDKEWKDEAIRKERLPGLLERGFQNKPGEENCKSCHNEESPSFHEFDYEKRKEEGTHEHFKE